MVNLSKDKQNDKERWERSRTALTSIAKSLSYECVPSQGPESLAPVKLQIMIYDKYCQIDQIFGRWMTRRQLRSRFQGNNDDSRISDRAATYFSQNLLGRVIMHHGRGGIKYNAHGSNR